MSIWKLLGLEAAEKREETPSSPETETVRKIAAKLNELAPDRAKFTAVFAYILSRVAHADREISDGETRAMERIVMERGGLSEEQAVLVVQMAKTQSIVFGGTEDYLVTREFNRIASPEEKLALLHCLFAVSASDEGISTIEDNEIRRIAKELHLTHQDFISVRVSYSEHLSVLKKPESQEGG